MYNGAMNEINCLACGAPHRDCICCLECGAQYGDCECGNEDDEELETQECIMTA